MEVSIKTIGGGRLAIKNDFIIHERGNVFETFNLKFVVKLTIIIDDKISKITFWVDRQSIDIQTTKDEADKLLQAFVD